jgi:hypothetical protein
VTQSENGRTQDETGNALSALMLAHDRRVLNEPLEETLQSRTSELLAWAKTMLPVINQSVRDARVQFQTRHQDLRSYFPQATVTTTDHRAATPTVTSPAPPSVPLLDIQQRFQSARTRMATTDHRAATPTVRDARAQLQTGHQDLRSYFSKATVPTTNHTAATPIVTTPARLNVPLLDIRQRFQSARTSFLRHSPVFPRHRRQYHLNPLDINIDKPQSRSRGHTCRRSGSNLSYSGTYAAELKIKFYFIDQFIR